MSLNSLSVSVLKEICSYLELENWLKLLATGAPYFSLLFSPGVLPSVTVFDDEIPVTFRKTLVYLLSSHRHIHTYTVHCSPWDVAIPFISEIPSDSDLFEINVKERAMKTTMHTYKARDRDMLALGGSRQVGYTYPVFNRFTHLRSINIDYSLPSSRKLPSYLSYWTDFYAAMPKALRQLSLCARGYDDAIRGLAALPQDLEVLRITLERDYSPSTLTVDDFTTVTMELFPRLLELSIYIPPLAVTSQDATSPQVSDNIDKIPPIIINGLVQSVTLLFDSGDFYPTQFSPITDKQDGVHTLEIAIGKGYISGRRLSITHDSLRSVYNALPPSLKTLKLGSAFSYPGMESDLPRSLTSLSWTAYSRFDINFEALPPRLRSLSTNCVICSPEAIVMAPKTLKYLQCALPLAETLDDDSVKVATMAALASFPDLKYELTS